MSKKIPYYCEDLEGHEDLLECRDFTPSALPRHGGSRQ